MIETRLITTKLDPNLLGQVVNIAGICSHELSMHPVSPENTLHELLQVTLCVEVSHYLEAIGHPDARGRHAELVVAFDAEQPERAIGFLMYCPLSGVVGQCGVYYTAVLPGWRRCGAFKTMLAVMLDRYPTAFLSCEIEAVPMYERLGFKVYGQREGQINMASGDYDSRGGMVLINKDALEQEPIINQCHSAMMRKHGQEAVIRALVELTEREAKRVERAKSYVAARLTEQAET